MFGYYPTFHALTSVGRKSTFSMLKICFHFSLLFLSFAVQSICLKVNQSHCATVYVRTKSRLFLKVVNILYSYHFVICCTSECFLILIHNSGSSIFLCSSLSQVFSIDYIPFGTDDLYFIFIRYRSDFWTWSYNPLDHVPFSAFRLYMLLYKDRASCCTCLRFFQKVLISCIFY